MVRTHQYPITVFLIVCLISFFLFFSGCVGKSSSPSDNTSPAWKLIWSDEFSDTTLNLSHWEYEENAWGGGNNELQYYTNRTNNSFINDGSLIIRAEKETYTDSEGTRNYTSARLRTKGKEDWTYGKVEVKAQIPSGKGIWPAIWMLPTDEIYGGWAASGEIDIMESNGSRPNQVQGTLHYGSNWPNNTYSGSSYQLPRGNFSDNYHIFTLIWNKDQINWYVDDVLYQTQNWWYCENGTFPAPFDQRFHLLLNVAVGGNYVGEPDETTHFPQEMKVDYVRVYQEE